MNKRYSFSFDPARCLKCYACEIACLQWHGIPAGTYKLRRVTEESSGLFPHVKRVFSSQTCRHCDSAPCAAVCPTGALKQRAEDGIVTVDAALCNGCRACLEACPFGIPEFDAEGLMHKCDMCLDRLEKGQPPVCAQSCPTRALQWHRG